MRFNKICSCGQGFTGARSARLCHSCSGYKPRPYKGTKSRFRFNERSLEDRDFKSYFLGFLCTDGSVTTGKDGRFKQVGWYSSELHHVQAITDKLGYGHKPYKVSDKGSGEWGDSLWADNARLIQSMGLSANKEDHSLKSMDVDLLPFLRGHFDGDGSVTLRETSIGRTLNKLSFLGRRTIMEDIQEGLFNIGFSCEMRKIVRDGKIPMYAVELGPTRAESPFRDDVRRFNLTSSAKEGFVGRSNENKSGGSIEVVPRTHNP